MISAVSYGFPFLPHGSRFLWHQNTSSLWKCSSSLLLFLEDVGTAALLPGLWVVQGGGSRGQGPACCSRPAGCLLFVHRAGSRPCFCFLCSPSKMCPLLPGCAADPFSFRRRLLGADHTDPTSAAMGSPAPVPPLPLDFTFLLWAPPFISQLLPPPVARGSSCCVHVPQWLFLLFLTLSCILLLCPLLSVVCMLQDEDSGE